MLNQITWIQLNEISHIKKKIQVVYVRNSKKSFWGRECDGYKWKVWWNDKMKGPLAMTLGDRPVFH